MNAVIRKAQNFNNWTVFYILVTITVLSLAFSARSHLEAGNVNWWSWADGAFQNFSTEMMGAIATFALFELIVGTRNEKKNLIIQMQSRDNATALNAVAQLRPNGWLRDGSLKDIYLRRANLEGAVLGAANLEGAFLEETNLKDANLYGAKLKDAYLIRTNLEGAYLIRTNLEGADLRNANLKGAVLEDANLKVASLEGANLQSANLREANLQSANLEDANLESANLEDANLKGAFLEYARFNEKTRLPNKKYWIVETDMSRYTDSSHEDFWQPDWAKEQDE